MKILIVLLLCMMLLTAANPVVAESHEQVLYEGSVTAHGVNVTLTKWYTKHIGGDFDADAMMPGSKIIAEYDGPADKNGIILGLASYSGGYPRWAIAPDSIETLANGRLLATFTYESIHAKMKGQMYWLDELFVDCTGDDEITLYTVTYLQGEGTPVSHGDSAWKVSDTGIAFLGDSITHNVKKTEGNFKRLLGREDCVIYGIGGQTYEHILNRIGDIASRNYSQLVIWCGINDLIYHGATPQQVMERVEKMLEIMRQSNPDISFVIVSVLPTSADVFADQQSIVDLNALYQAYADAHEDVAFCNIYPAFVGEDGYCIGNLMRDGLRPNSSGYQILAEQLPIYLIPQQ